MRTAMTLNVTTICGIIGSANHRLSNRSMVMPSNAAPIVQQIQGDFHALIAYVTGPEAQTHSAYTVFAHTVPSAAVGAGGRSAACATKNRRSSAAPIASKRRNSVSSTV